MGVELFHADGRTDVKLIVVICSLSNAPDINKHYRQCNLNNVCLLQKSSEMKA